MLKLNKDCKNVIGLMPAWLIDKTVWPRSMPKSEHQDVSNHLALCAPCRKLFDAWEQFDREMVQKLRSSRESMPDHMRLDPDLSTADVKAPISRAGIAQTVASPGGLVQKAVKVKKDNPRSTDDYAHAMASMKPFDHAKHMRQHESEFTQLRRKLYATEGAADKDELVRKMRQVAVHWAKHRAAKCGKGALQKAVAAGISWEAAMDDVENALERGPRVARAGRVTKALVTDTGNSALEKLRGRLLPEGAPHTGNMWILPDGGRVDTGAPGGHFRTADAILGSTDTKAFSDNKDKLMEHSGVVRINHERSGSMWMHAVNVDVYHPHVTTEQLHAIQSFADQHPDSGFRYMIRHPSTGFQKYGEGLGEFERDLSRHGMVKGLPLGELAKALSLKPGEITWKRAKAIGDSLGVDWGRVPLDQFANGLGVELEHRDVTKGDPIATARIALAHLREDKDYYIKLREAEG